MSVAAHHNDWLNLVEVSGPFLALPVLMDALPAGLDKPDRELTADLWRAFTEWSDEVHGGATDPAVHEAWVRYVFEHVLEFDTDVLVREGDALDTWTVEVPEHDARLTPDLVIRDPGDEEETARLLVTVVAPDVSVTEPSETGWSASPAERMESLLRDPEARLGIVTNGDQWTLIHVAEGENTGFATWYASLWREEPLTLRAFITLLGMRRFFAVAENETLDALLDRSREDQHGVTTQLGKQVRRAVEILIQQIDRVDDERDGRLLEGMTEERLYESAVTVMMRLIFLFYAEENDLLLLGDDFYDQNYAASTLREQLQATADESGEEILERLHDAWPRLLSTFRAVHTGVEHEQMRLPAYGGALFDPDRYPFLEGREPGTTWAGALADPLPIDNRTVLHLLNAIQTLEVRIPGGGRENRPLSFRALDVEQIGHVYETLLDHTAVRAGDWVFGLEGTKDREPEVPLGELEARADDEEELVEYLKNETGRSAGALKKRVAAEEKAVYDRWGQRWLPAFHGDESAARRASHWGLLVREDSAEHPVVVPPGRIFVTESERRRSSGTHYTPRSLTEEIVTHALEPLVYDGPAEDNDRATWVLRPADEILNLKVCDPACGSGAFLVQACRFLAERLFEAWNEHGASDGPDGHALPAHPEERLIVARRYVADRCLYGVDVNALATEMAKLSLWLVTLQKDRPFTFLDHAVRSGDSLLGVTDFKTLETFGVSKGQTQLWSQSWEPQLQTAREARERLRSFTTLEPEDSIEKDKLLHTAVAALPELQLVGDAISGLQIASSSLSASAARSLRTELGSSLSRLMNDGDDTASIGLTRRIAELLNLSQPQELERRQPFHWVLEFPEVLWNGEDSGFDAVVGNPPFRGGSIFSRELGGAYRDYLVEHVASGAGGRVDLCAFFLLRYCALAASGGSIGVVATRTLSEGHSRRTGLDQLVKDGWGLRRATSTMTWPGEANLEICQLWLMRDSAAMPVLDRQEVPRIGTDLAPVIEGIDEAPCQLRPSSTLSFRGVEIRGKGFLLSEREAKEMVSIDPRNSDIIRPYLSGSDLNSNANLLSSRYVIDFGVRDFDEASRYEGPFRHASEHVKPQRDKLKGPIHEQKFWLHWDKRLKAFEAINEQSLVIVKALDSATWAWAVIDNHRQLLAHKLVIIKGFDWALLSALQSSIHFEWTVLNGGTIGAGMSYRPTDCLETFPFPVTVSDDLRELGRTYDGLRRKVMSQREIGLTSLMNLVNEASRTESDLRSLRDLIREIDRALLDSLGLTAVALDHAFSETEFGAVWTLSMRSRIEVLRAVMELNRDQHKRCDGHCYVEWL